MELYVFNNNHAMTVNLTVDSGQSNMRYLLCAKLLTQCQVYELTATIVLFICSSLFLPD